MAEHRRSGKLAVILHADIASSTDLVHQDEQLAHERIQETFHRFGDTITKYHGHVRELRGDALLAEFERASDAVTAALVFQTDQLVYNAQLKDSVQPTVRVGIAMGEVIIADATITGAGVVLAQRLEQLSEPGSVVIQGAAYETIPGRFPFEYANLGENDVKGFDEPVRVYSVNLKRGAVIPPPSPLVHSTRNTMIALASVAVVAASIALMWLAPWEEHEELASVERMAFPLPDKPSIAVLPFANMSDDAEQEYFADGMTDDLITDLSKISALFVIARNSSFSYKDQSIKISQVAEELGVRYILEGSVRRAGDQIRINAQLIDATTGGHLWAERYDRRYADIFNLQNELLGRIVAALALKLTPTEEKHLARQETDSVQAYDAFLQGWANYELRTAKGFIAAEPFLKKAIELDPNYSRAHAALAATYWLGARRRGLAIEHLKQAMENPTPVAHRVASLINTHAGRHDEAISDAEKAISLDPNDPVGYFAMNRALTFAGRPAEAVENIKKAMRLNPHYPVIYLYRLAFAQFGLERYSEAAATLEKSLSRDPDFRNSLKLLVPTYGHLNRISEAKEIAIWPSCGYAAQYKLEIDRQRWCDGIRKARVAE